MLIQVQIHRYSPAQCDARHSTTHNAMHSMWIKVREEKCVCVCVGGQRRKSKKKRKKNRGKDIKGAEKERKRREKRIGFLTLCHGSHCICS